MSFADFTPFRIDASGVEILSKVLDTYPVARIGEREAA